MNVKRLISRTGLTTLLLTFGLAVGFADDQKKPAKPPAASAAKVLDINSATQAELEALPAIGKVKASKIIAGRPFKGKDDLVGKGILSAAEYAKVKDLIIAKQAK
jgi:DNA uptake protein ComE-like DNA-binding protein